MDLNLCRMLNEAKGSLLDDEQLLTTLQTSKATSQEVSESLVVSEATEIQIDEAREVCSNLRCIFPTSNKIPHLPLQFFNNFLAFIPVKQIFISNDFLNKTDPNNYLP